MCIFKQLLQLPVYYMLCGVDLVKILPVSELRIVAYLTNNNRSALHAASELAPVSALLEAYAKRWTNQTSTSNEQIPESDLVEQNER